MDGFQQNIKTWVSLDSQLKILNEKAKDIRNQRNELTSNIIDFADTNNLASSTIKITDGKLKFAQNKQTSPITLGFLESCLSDIISNEDEVSQIMEYIKQKREQKKLQKNKLIKYENKGETIDNSIYDKLLSIVDVNSKKQHAIKTRKKREKKSKMSRKLK